MKILNDYGTHVEVYAGTRSLTVLLDTTDYVRLLYMGVPSLHPLIRKNKVAEVRFKLKGKSYGLGRFITTCPLHLEADHISRNPLDNRQSNLRCVTHRENCLNRDNTRKYPGVCKNGDRWKARITLRYGCKYLGTYDTEIEAHAVYMKAKDLYTANS